MNKSKHIIISNRRRHCCRSCCWLMFFFVLVLFLFFNILFILLEFFCDFATTQRPRRRLHCCFFSFSIKNSSACRRIQERENERRVRIKSTFRMLFWNIPYNYRWFFFAPKRYYCIQDTAADADTHTHTQFPCNATNLVFWYQRKERNNFDQDPRFITPLMNKSYFKWIHSKFVISDNIV